MKLGVIGSGMIVHDYLPGIVTLDGIEVKSILSTKRSLPVAQKLAEDLHIPFVTSDFEEFVNSGIDTAYVAVPNHLHFEMASRVLKRGLNAIVEKPFTSNTEEAYELKRLAEVHEVYVFEAITTVHLDNFFLIKDLLPEIGRLRMARASFCKYSSRYEPFRKGEILRTFDPACSGGALTDLGVYNLHFLLGLFGRPEEAVYYPNIIRNIDTSGIMILKYGDFTAESYVTKDAIGPSGGVIQGEDGCISFDLAPSMIGNITLEKNDGTKRVYEDQLAGKRYSREFAFFKEIIEKKDEQAFDSSMKQTLLVMNVMTNARKKSGILFDADKK